jgi:hypothetical protein
MLNTGQWLLRFSVLGETLMTSILSIPFQKAKMLRSGEFMLSEHDVLEERDSGGAHVTAEPAFHTGKEIILVRRIFPHPVFEKSDQHVQRDVRRASPDAFSAVDAMGIRTSDNLLSVLNHDGIGVIQNRGLFG